MHISAIEDKTAAILAAADLDNDDYHRAIQRAAETLISKDMAEATYITGYGSGSTVWSMDSLGIMVEPRDWIEA